MEITAWRKLVGAKAVRKDLPKNSSSRAILPFTIAQAILRHSGIQTTADIYARVSCKSMIKGLQTLDADT